MQFLWKIWIHSKGNVDVDDNPEDDVVIFEDDLDSFGRQFNLRKAHKAHEITGGLDDVNASALKKKAVDRSSVYELKSALNRFR